MLPAPQTRHHRRTAPVLRLFRAIGALGTTITLCSVAHAVDYYKADNLTSPTSAASWWLDAEGTLPAEVAPTNNTSPSQICIWNNLVTGPQSLTFPDVGMHTIRILNPGGPIAIDGTNSPRTITMANGGGVDMTQATQDLTFTNLFHRLPSSGSVGNINVAAGRTLTYGAGAQVNVRQNSSNATLNINTDGTSAGTVTFAANVAPSHIVIGAGHVEFNNPTGNSRLSTNTTTLNGGVTLVGNTSGSATGSGTVAVNAGATLGGTGLISGTVTAAADSILSPGKTGTGTLSLGRLTLESGSNLVWEAANTADADLLAVTAADGLTINGGVIHLHNPGTTDPFTGTGLYNLISYSGALGGTGIEALTIAEETKVPGRTYTLGLGAGVITLRVTSGTITPIDWAVNASGNWSTGSNWTGGAAPDAIGALARIPGATGATFTAPRAITLDGPRTVGQLVLDATQPTTLSGASALTFNDDGAAASLTASGANHTIGAPIALTAGGMLATVEGVGHTLTLSQPVSGTDVGLVKIGEGTLLLTADNTYTGPTSVGLGTLQIGNGGTSGSVAGALSTSGTIRFNRSDSVTLGAPISGTGDVVFAGTGDTGLTVANTFNGDTTITAGTLVLAHGQALQNSTLTHSTSGGALVVAEPVDAITLGGLAGDRSIPLTNTAATPLALTVGGNGDSTTYSGSPVGTGTTFTKTGSGTLALSGSHGYSGDTTVSAGVLSIDSGATFNTAAVNLGTASSAHLLVNGGTLNASASSLVTNASVGITVAGGVANFDGGIVSDANNSSAESLVAVTGGTLNAASISMSRGSLNQGSEPASGQVNQGLYINGGAVNITGALNIGAVSGANSSVSSRMDSGSLTVGGPITIGINNTSRWSTFDINGGTLVADAPEGIFLGGAFAGNVVMHIRGNAEPTVKTGRIQFGQSDLAGSAILNLTSGSLYVGQGGLTLGTTNETFNALMRLNGGNLGATADWSSTVPMEFNGAVVLTGADEANTPHTVRLHGAATGIGAVVKNGAGTVLLTSPTSSFYGPVNVLNGTLGVGGQIQDMLTVAEGAAFAPQSVFTAGFGAIINGALVIDYNSAAETPVSRLETPYDITLGANSSLTVSGSGLLPGPAYVVAKASFGISGTFANVSLPDGFTLDYNYDDGSGTPAIAIVGASVGSPYDNWAASFSLAGPDADTTADPDGDGLVNLLEYALSTSPVAGDSADAYALARSGNFLTLTFDHPADNSLTYTIEATNDLAGTWSTVHTFLPFTTPGTETYTDTADLTVTPRRFLRLKVTATP